MKFFILFIFLFCSQIVFSQNKIKTGTIIKVSDGDTYTIKSDTLIFKVRLFGIDCPEMNQPFGIDAKNFALNYLNKNIEYISVDMDRYGRIVADLFYKGDKINYLLVSYGFAWHYKKYSNDTILAQREAKARAVKIGLWGQPNPIAPWEWRKLKK